MRLDSEFKELSGVLRPIVDTHDPDKMDPVLKKHLARLERALSGQFEATAEDGSPLEEGDIGMLATIGAKVGDVAAAVFAPLAATTGGLALGATGVLAIRWFTNWVRDKKSLFKKFEPDDFVRLFEEQIRPILREFIQDSIIEKLTDKMTPEWWVAYNRRYTIRARVSEKMDAIISREVAPRITKALADAFNDNLGLMEKELKMMIIRQGERPAGKLKAGGWQSGKVKKKKKDEKEED